MGASAPSGPGDVLRSAAPVFAFTCYTLETATGVVAAAVDAHRPVILLVADSVFAAPSGPSLVRALRAVADPAPVPVFVQLDHCSDLGRIAAAVDAGAHAVMADGSTLPYEDNVAFTRRAVELVADRGVCVEAELGRIEGDEDVDRAAAVSEAMTDPGQAVDFVARTGVDCLAVAVGNVHGSYRGEVRLDLDRLADVAAAAGVPLALHGASGVPDAVLADAVRCGAAKVNVNTELRAAAFDVLARRVGPLTGGLRTASLVAELEDAARTVAAGKFAVGAGAPGTG
ncbi:class II fructose-bisphosphate aldolase [Nocardiopsis sp. NPDC050513]|uniref:class II fructose-bisphosphate aldolase n=1 Tax=Nocardiopsis sp. NPDC050513 TaxID=3364338 RepID=UPI00378B6C7D